MKNQSAAAVNHSSASVLAQCVPPAMQGPAGFWCWQGEDALGTGIQLTHEEGANPEHSAVPEHAAAAGSHKRPQTEMDGGVTCSEWDFYTSLLPEDVSQVFFLRVL